MVDIATGSPVVTINTADSEMVTIAWHNRAKLCNVLQEVVDAAADTVFDMAGWDAPVAGAHIFHTLVLDLLGRNTARGKIYEAKCTGSHLKRSYVVR